MEINNFQLNMDQRTRTDESGTADLFSDRPASKWLKFQSSRWNHVLILYVYIPTYSDLICFAARFDQFDPVWQNAWWIQRKLKKIHEMRDDFILKRDLKKLYHVTVKRFLKVSPGALLSHSWNFINTVFLRWLKQSLFELNSNVSALMISEGFSSWCHLDQSNSVEIWNIDILRRKIVNCIFC